MLRGDHTKKQRKNARSIVALLRQLPCSSDQHDKGAMIWAHLVATGSRQHELCVLVLSYKEGVLCLVY